MIFFLLLVVGIRVLIAKKHTGTNVGVGPEETKDEAGYNLLYNPPAGGNPENSGKILFCSDPSDSEKSVYYLYIINSDGSGKMKLPDFGKSMRHPVWSPEYSRIAYSALVDNKDKIFIMTADGSQHKQLTFGEDRDVFPTWSPDGQYLAYISYKDNTPNLYVMDIQGRNTKQLTFVEGKDTVLWPSWSPISDVIAYSYNKAGEEIDFRIRTIKSDGTGMREILSSDDPDLGDYDPAWSPDGKMLYFLSNRSSQMEIWKIDYDKLQSQERETGQMDFQEVGLKQISNLYGANVSPDHRPRISPDGKKIVFYGVGADWQNVGTNLYTINTDGTGLTNITKSTDNDEWPDW
jgi:TolB protein